MKTSGWLLLLCAVAAGSFYLGAAFEARRPGVLAAYLGTEAVDTSDYSTGVEVGQPAVGEVVQVIDGDSLWFADGNGRRAEGRGTVPGQLAAERATNPFLRADQPEVKAAAAARLGNAPESTVGSFAAIREWKNVFR